MSIIKDKMKTNKSKLSTPPRNDEKLKVNIHNQEDSNIRLKVVQVQSNKINDRSRQQQEDLSEGSSFT